MTEALIYLSISLFAVALFAIWYARQGKAAEKKWLMSQLAQADKSNEQQFLEPLKKLEQKPSSTAKMSLLAALLIIPASFFIDYVWFHEIPIEQRVSASETPNVPDLATAIRQLEQKLSDNPNDLQGQMLYGQTMMSIRDYPKAVSAYQKANEIDPGNANILTALGEAIAFKNNTGSFLGEPEQYLAEAIAIDPNNQKAMWLQGIVFFENQQHQQAEDIWSRLLTQVESPNVKATITKQINQARAALNKAPLEQTAADEPVLYAVVIDADETVKNMTLSETSRLFVFAKQVNGPPMPIAAVPLTSPFNWPILVEMSDQNSLNPNRKLSQFEQLELSAKISLSGNATPDESDIVANAKVAQKNSQPITLTLNHKP